MTDTVSPPSPQLFFETLNAFQKTAALMAAIDLGFEVPQKGLCLHPLQEAELSHHGVRAWTLLCSRKYSWVNDI